MMSFTFQGKFAIVLGSCEIRRKSYPGRAVMGLSPRQSGRPKERDDDWQDVSR